MERRMPNPWFVATVILLPVLAWTWYNVGVATERQRTVPIACDANVDSVVVVRTVRPTGPVCRTCGPKTDGPTPDSVRVK